MAKVHQLLDRTRITSDGNVAFIRMAESGASEEAEVSDTMQVPLCNELLFWSSLADAGEAASGVSEEVKVGVDLTGWTEVRHIAAVTTADASANTPITILQYSLDNSAWSTLTSNSISLSATGIQITEWESIPVAARTTVLIRAFASGGDDGGSPDAVGVTAFFRR
jgi:hypothetical protein